MNCLPILILGTLIITALLPLQSLVLRILGLQSGVVQVTMSAHDVGQSIELARFRLVDIPQRTDSILVDVKIDNPEGHIIAICYALTAGGKVAPVARNKPCTSQEGELSAAAKPTAVQGYSIVERATAVRFGKLFTADNVVLSEAFNTTRLSNHLDGNDLIVIVENHNMLLAANFEARVLIECQSTFGVRSIVRGCATLAMSILEEIANSSAMQRVDETIAPFVRWLAVSDTCLRIRGSWYQPKRQLPELRKFVKEIAPADAFGLGRFTCVVVESVYNMFYDGHLLIAGIIILNCLLYLPFRGRLHDRPQAVGICAENWSFARVFTSSFTHANFVHLILNMVALQQFGPLVHRTVDCNNVVFLALYVVAAVVAAAPSAFQRHVSVGASGAIYGVQAALMALQLHSNVFGVDCWQAFVAYMVVDTVRAMSLPFNIDVLGHLGGAVAGYSLGSLYNAIG
jgi:membrane associated rhomboid family serine protease